MALRILADECTSCGDCEPVCPTSSISMGKVAYQIDKSTCTECEGDFNKPQCVKVCPIDGCILPIEA